jgi:hypothetical protein
LHDYAPNFAWRCGRRYRQHQLCLHVRRRASTPIRSPDRAIFDNMNGTAGLAEFH